MLAAEKNCSLCLESPGCSVSRTLRVVLPFIVGAVGRLLSLMPALVVGYNLDRLFRRTVEPVGTYSSEICTCTFRCIIEKDVQESGNLLDSLGMQLDRCLQR